MSEREATAPRSTPAGPVIMPPLIYAASKGYSVIVKTLLHQGCAVNERASDGSTALMWAARHGHIETVETLLKCGADARVRDATGRTAHDYATLASRNEIAFILEIAVDASAQ